MDILGRMESLHIVKPAAPNTTVQNPFLQNLKRCEMILGKIKHIRLFIEEFSPRKLTEVTDLKKTFREFDEMLQ